MKYRPYSIRTPALDPTSGGIRVMWGLYGWLLSKGQIAYVNARYDNPNFVGIYPEIYSGNDMNAGTVVRYILQTPGVMGTTDQFGVFRQGPTEFPHTDKIFVFSKIYDTFGVDDNHLLFLPILNLHLFEAKKQKREKTCYLVGKGKNQFKHPDNSIELSREFASDQKALADLINECHTFYCYDRLSAMMDIARLCGCKVQYYGEFPKEELAKYETGLNGLGYGDEGVKLDVEAFREHYKGMVDTFSTKLDTFIELTQT